MTNAEALDLFRQTGALLEGHFVLRSGLHSRQFFQCALALQQMPIVEKFGAAIAQRVAGLQVQTVISPAMGGLVIGQEVARQLGCRFRIPPVTAPCIAMNSSRVPCPVIQIHTSKSGVLPERIVHGMRYRGGRIRSIGRIDLIIHLFQSLEIRQKAVKRIPDRFPIRPVSAVSMLEWISSA